MTRFLIISIFIFVNQLSANNKDEKIFKNIISDYNIEKSIENFEFTEEQSKKLCGENPISIDCEIKTIYVMNEITKKRILHLLNQISQKGEEIEIIDNLIYNKELQMISKSLSQIENGQTKEHDEVWSELLK